MPASAVRPRTGFRLGTHLVRRGLALAPMAGNTNLAYRRLCRKFGAELTTTEMVSACALVHQDRKSLRLLARGEDEVPVAAQLFGTEPALLAEAARRVEDLGFHAVDFNMGCPVPKITGGGGGSALLREPETAARCIEAMASAVSIPVTAKIRAGWDDAHRNAPEVARLLEAAGVQVLTVHGRTREQKYAGRSDYRLIGEVVAAVSVPVIGNGDVDGPERAAELLAQGVAGIAVGRGALGRPWLFARLAAQIDGRPEPPPPAAAERRRLLIELAEGVCALHGEGIGMRIMRRLAADFFRDTPGAAEMRRRCQRLERLEDLRRLALGRAA